MIYVLLTPMWSPTSSQDEGSQLGLAIIMANYEVPIYGTSFQLCRYSIGK